MSAGNFKTLIANRLKSYRKSKSMSLDATARVTGVSKAMLGQIERRESAPTIATLWKIASGLNISFSSFFTDAASREAPASIFPGDPDMRVRVVFPYDPATRMETFEITLTNHHHQRSGPHQPGVIEHVVMTRGTMEIFVENERRGISAGEALRFHADVDHEYRAVTEEAVFLNIISYA